MHPIEDTIFAGELSGIGNVAAGESDANVRIVSDVRARVTSRDREGAVRRGKGLGD
jgi:hypothetical protein